MVIILIMENEDYFHYLKEMKENGRLSYTKYPGIKFFINRKEEEG
uniref:Uncharacterized protein n=1 Tax=viral metagenome TaxID=1070528 RepID=A0A6M3L0Y7_9ZZZZ